MVKFINHSIGMGFGVNLCSIW
uniref:Uncharacterized protein n=1 Tax=Anguilla anguilla TaxID=7936 RepID=A0A0E9TTH8_ANGAN